MKKQELSAAVLAGGKSRRMGMDKLLLPVKGRPLIANLCDCCGGFHELILSTAKGRDYTEAIRTCKTVPVIVYDEMEDIGALEGLYQAIKKASTKAVVVVAGDMPGISGEFLTALVKIYDETKEDILILETEDGIHPLCGIYSTCVLPGIEQMRKNGIYKIRRLFADYRMNTVRPEELGFTPLTIRNVNTPEEYKKTVEEA